MALCGQKELPAQSLYIMLNNEDLIIKFVSQQEFGQVFLPLISKSLACGVPKLQILALSKVQSIYEKIDYTLFKSQVMPRVLQVLDTAKDLTLKLEVFVTLKTTMKIIDAQTLRTDVMKALERLRARETDPKVCMRMLETYEEIAKILGPEEVGQKILPGIIPMLITGQYTKTEFKDVLSSVRRLIDQIEVHRLPQLPETPQVLGQGVNMGGTSADAEVKDLFAGVSGGGGQDLFSSTPAPSKDGDLFAFLGGGGASHGSSATTSADPFGGSGGMPAPSNSGMGDVFGSQSQPAADPFAGSMGNSTSNQPKLGGWDDDPIASSFGSFGNQPQKQQPSNTFGQPSQPFGGQSSQPFGGSSSAAFGQQPDPFKQADPFQSQQRPDPFGGLSKGPSTSSGLDLNNMSQKKKSSNMDMFGSSNNNASKPDPFAGVNPGMGMG